jgi:peptidoglycan hydrolase CwlO-like protein
MRKKIIAFVVAFVITGIVAVSMLVVGVNAAFNKNGVPVSNSPAQSASLQSSVSSSADPQTQIAQLQSLVNQYQAREQQYQTELQNAQTQVTQAQQEMQTMQQLLSFLQQRGIITIDSQGNITVNVGRRGDGFGG